MSMTRRDLLKTGLAAGGGLAAMSTLPPSLLRALADKPSCGSLNDIEHVVILIQENRGFDHYFGRYKGVRGFDDRTVTQPDGSSIFSQKVDDKGGRLLPWNIDTTISPQAPPRPGDCTDDIDHQWLGQHTVWNKGAMDQWVLSHQKTNPSDAALTMGYYERKDIEFYYALADQFTICDAYHCSTIGGTDINRMFSMTGTIDPDGWDGGAQFLDTRVSDRPKWYGALGKAGKWVTYPEQLQAKGVSWKVYSTADGQQLDNILLYFKNYQSPSSPLFQNAFGSQNAPPYLADFTADCQAGTLPSVSWIVAGAAECEHPPAAIEWGADFTYHVLQAITLNPALWAKTALFITYDENGGFFDHVPPPVPDLRTPGEFFPSVPAGSPAYTESGNGTVLDPIGLGFRVPLLVVSPFSRGGFVCSDTLDHTSLLRFLETRFGAEIPTRDAKTQRPGLSEWRRKTVGDLTAAFNFAAAPDSSAPSFSSAQTPNRADPRVVAECGPLTTANLTGQTGEPYPPPATQRMPVQEPGTAKRPSGLDCKPSQSSAPAAQPSSAQPQAAVHTASSAHPAQAINAQPASARLSGALSMPWIPLEALAAVAALVGLGGAIKRFRERARTVPPKDV